MFIFKSDAERRKTTILTLSGKIDPYTLCNDTVKPQLN